MYSKILRRSTEFVLISLLVTNTQAASAAGVLSNDCDYSEDIKGFMGQMFSKWRDLETLLEQVIIKDKESALKTLEDEISRQAQGIKGMPVSFSALGALSMDEFYVQIKFVFQGLYVSVAKRIAKDDVWYYDEGTLYFRLESPSDSDSMEDSERVKELTERLETALRNEIDPMLPMSQDDEQNLERYIFPLLYNK